MITEIVFGKEVVRIPTPDNRCMVNDVTCEFVSMPYNECSMANCEAKNNKVGNAIFLTLEKYPQWVANRLKGIL